MNCGLLEDSQLVNGRARTRAQAVGEVRASGVIVSVCACVRVQVSSQCAAQQELAAWRSEKPVL